MSINHVKYVKTKRNVPFNSIIFDRTTPLTEFECIFSRDASQIKTILSKFFFKLSFLPNFYFFLKEYTLF